MSSDATLYKNGYLGRAIDSIDSKLHYRGKDMNTFEEAQKILNGRPDKENILEEANRLVHGARQETYAHPLDNFKRIAEFWSTILGTEVNEEQVGMCMIAVKMARLINSPDHRDTIVDIAEYAETISMVIEERKRREAASIKDITSGTISSDKIKAGTVLYDNNGNATAVISNGKSDRSFSGWNPNESAHP